MLRARDEPEAPVVVEVAEEHHDPELHGVGGAENGVHHRVADAAALVFRKYSQRPETDRGLVVEVADRADDVADQTTCRVLCDEREGRDPALIGAEPLHPTLRTSGGSWPSSRAKAA